MIAGVCLISGCLNAGSCAGTPPAELRNFLQQCAQFLLRSGGDVLRYAAAKRLPSAMTTGVLTQQAMTATMCLMSLALFGSRAQAERCVPPDAMHAWLAAARAALEAVAVPVWKPGEHRGCGLHCSVPSPQVAPPVPTPMLCAVCRLA